MKKLTLPCNKQQLEIWSNDLHLPPSYSHTHPHTRLTHTHGSHTHTHFQKPQIQMQDLLGDYYSRNYYLDNDLGLNVINFTYEIS